MSRGMTEFDHAGWVGRAHSFVMGLARVSSATVHSAAVAAPVSAVDLATIEQRLGSALPTSLRDLFVTGAEGIDCRYVFEPNGGSLDELREILPDEIRIYGGARFGPASELPEFSVAVGEWAEDTWVADEPDQRAIWDAALPFARLDNGDYLALDLRTDESNSPVVYLNHDDESAIIAPDLVAFLSAWERLCYLGPEHWLLLEFTDGRGHLDPDSDRATRLRRLFAG